jgi:MYXO-CTERM domain-containing protein
MGRGAQSRHGSLRRRAISVACAMALLATPAGALADQPATDQYTPPSLNATGNGSGPGAGGAAQTNAAEGSSGSDSPVVPILLGGLGVIAAAGLIVYRRRRGAAGGPA